MGPPGLAVAGEGDAASRGTELCCVEPDNAHRIRTGDYRVIFRAMGPDVVIVRVMHRSTVYDP